MSTVSALSTVGPGSGAASSETCRYLTFTLNGEAYALDIFHVTEIIEHRHLTAVPMMPDYVRGVINLRGRAVPVIDLGVRFARGMTTIARRTSIIIVHIDGGLAGGRPASVGIDQHGQDVGILVDAVNKVVSLSEDEIEPPPAFGAGIRADFISGMAKRDTDFVIVLDIDRVLSEDDLLNLHGATQNADSGATEG